MFSRSNQRLKFTFLLTIKLVCFFGCCEFANGQGRLSKVREQVREDDSNNQAHQHEDDSSSANPSSSGSLQRIRKEVRKPHNKQDHDDHDHHRSNRRRRSRDHHHGSFYSYVYQPVFVEPPCHRAPLYVEPCSTTIIYPSDDPIIYDSYEPLPNPVNQTPVYSSPVQTVDITESVEREYLWSDFSNWAARGSISIGADFDDLSQGSLNFLFQNPGGLGLDLGVTTLRESGMDFRDHLWIGDVNFVFEPVNSSYVRVRMGAGLNWLADSYDGDAGFNLTAGADIWLNDRLTLSGEADLGTLGDSDYWHGRLMLSRRFQNMEWIVGIDHYDIGGVNLHNVFTGIGFKF